MVFIYGCKYSAFWCNGTCLFIFVFVVIISQADRDLCMRLLLKVKGVISITFDMTKKRCLLRVKFDVKPEVCIYVLLGFFPFFKKRKAPNAGNVGIIGKSWSVTSCLIGHHATYYRFFIAQNMLHYLGPKVKILTYR